MATIFAVVNNEVVYDNKDMNNFQKVHKFKLPLIHWIKEDEIQIRLCQGTTSNIQQSALIGKTNLKYNCIDYNINNIKLNLSPNETEFQFNFQYKVFEYKPIINYVLALMGNYTLKIPIFDIKCWCEPINRHNPHWIVNLNGLVLMITPTWEEPTYVCTATPPNNVPIASSFK